MQTCLAFGHIPCKRGPGNVLVASAVALFLFLVAGAAPCHAGAAMMQLTAQLETFRLESTDKLEDLYRLRKVYIDSNNTAGTEGAQIFIGELRTNVFLISNVLDIMFLYRMHRPYDDKGLMGEYVTSRLQELLESLRYNIRKMDDLSQILAVQGQETLSQDFGEYRISLIKAADAVKSIEGNLASNASTAADDSE